MHRLRLAAVRERRVVTQTRHLGKFSEDVTKEESEPDAFALAMPADEIHAVVPVAGPDQRQSMRAESETMQNRPHAVQIDIRAFVGPARQVVVRVVLRIDRAAFEKVRGLVENRHVAGGQDVAACRQWQPKVIVRAMRAYTPSRRRMPPMLDVAFQELTARTERDLRAHEARFSVNEGHHVLQLVAETKGSARLVVAAARP